MDKEDVLMTLPPRWTGDVRVPHYSSEADIGRSGFRDRFEKVYYDVAETGGGELELLTTRFICSASGGHVHAGGSDSVLETQRFPTTQATGQTYSVAATTPAARPPVHGNVASHSDHRFRAFTARYKQTINQSTLSGPSSFLDVMNVSLRRDDDARDTPDAKFANIHDRTYSRLGFAHVPDEQNPLAVAGTDSGISLSTASSLYIRESCLAYLSASDLVGAAVLSTTPSDSAADVDAGRELTLRDARLGGDSTARLIRDSVDRWTTGLRRNLCRLVDSMPASVDVVPTRLRHWLRDDVLELYRRGPQTTSGDAGTRAVVRWGGVARPKRKTQAKRSRVDKVEVKKSNSEPRLRAKVGGKMGEGAMNELEELVEHSLPRRAISVPLLLRPSKLLVGDFEDFDEGRGAVEGVDRPEEERSALIRLLSSLAESFMCLDYEVRRSILALIMLPVIIFLVTVACFPVFIVVGFLLNLFVGPDFTAVVFVLCGAIILLYLIRFILQKTLYIGEKLKGN